MMQQLDSNTIKAAAHDAGNRSMRKAGRQAWSREDWDAAEDEFHRLHDILRHSTRKDH